MGLALALVALVAGSPFAGGPVPSTVVNSYRAAIDEPPGIPFTLFWQAPDAEASIGADGDRSVEVDGTYYSGDFVEPGRFPAPPDSGLEPGLADRISPFVLAQARRGRRRLVETAVDGRAAYRTAFPLTAKDCAPLPWARTTVWLDRRTLLPLRVVYKPSRLPALVATYRYSDLNEPLPASTFAPPSLAKGAIVRNRGFVRASLEDSARHASYFPSLPAALPPGFGLAVSGWAPKSSTTGSEGSNPPSPELFAAVYRRGWEEIAVTERLADPAWTSDPFGVECGFEWVERAHVGSAVATYGIGRAIVPHLYWQQGQVLFTVSGPFPKADLVAIASSLRPLGS